MNKPKKVSAVEYLMIKKMENDFRKTMSRLYKKALDAVVMAPEEPRKR